MLYASEVYGHYRTVTIKDQTASNLKGAQSRHFDPGKGGGGGGVLPFKRLKGIARISYFPKSD